MNSKLTKRVALVGNPNCGKTSIFNSLTGLNQRVGNFPGVTVERKAGTLKINEQSIRLIDLPGAYSLNPKSPDEKVVHDILLDPLDKDHPDLVVVVLDASNLKRNLFFATQVLDLGIEAICVLNMTDLAARKGIKIDAEALEGILNVAVVEYRANKSFGMDALKRQIFVGGNVAHPIFQTGEDLKSELEHLEDDFPKHSLFGRYNILSGNEENLLLSPEIRKRFKTILLEHNITANRLQLDEISARYKSINQINKNVSKDVSGSKEARKLTSRFDRVLTHKIWGTLIFLLAFFLLFQAVFTLAEYPMNWIDEGMSQLNQQIGNWMPQGLLNDFITDGILSGLAGVVIFIPQIMILFGLITILEDSGYMARVSFINDKLLGSVGMNGKSIVPLVGGFACAVPAIMAARAIENPRERLITILITPLMGCSARLPVYIFLVAFIVPDDYIFGIINLQGLFMLGLYVLGVLMSVVVAMIFNMILKGEKGGSFIMEMPAFKIPQPQNVLNNMVNKGKTFIYEAGKIIMIVSMVLWVLSSFGPGNSFEDAESRVRLYEHASTPEQLEGLISSEQLKVSYAGYMGRFIEPAIEPLGFDWKIGIALITSFAAREVFVGTMSTIYSVEGGANSISELQEKLKNEINPGSGLPILSMPTAFSLVIFYVFAMQCMSTLAVSKKETGGWKWPIVQTIYLTVMAYLCSLLSYQMLTGF